MPKLQTASEEAENLSSSNVKRNSVVSPDTSNDAAQPIDSNVTNNLPSRAGKKESETPAESETSSQSELSPEERWKQFDVIMAKLSGELRLLSQEAAFQTLLVCSHLSQKKFDKYLNTLLPEDVNDEKEVEQAGSSWVSAVSGAIARRFSSTTPTKNELKKSLQRLYAFLTRLKKPELKPGLNNIEVIKRRWKSKEIFSQVKANVILEAVKVLRSDSQGFSKDGVLPTIKSFKNTIMRLKQQLMGGIGKYLNDNEKELTAFLRAHIASVQDVYRVADYFKENKINKDPIQTLQILLDKTEYGYQVLVEHPELLTDLAEHCDKLGSFFRPSVISLEKLKKHVPHRLSDLSDYSSKIETLVFDKKLLLDDILNLSEKGFGYVLEMGEYLRSITGESIIDEVSGRESNQKLMSFLCNLDESVKSILSSHKLAVLSYMKRHQAELKELVGRENFKDLIKKELKEICWPTLASKVSELLKHSVFTNDERALILMAFIQIVREEITDEYFQEVINTLQEKKKSDIEEKIQKDKKDRGDLWLASLRTDSLEQTKAESLAALELSVKDVKRVTKEITTIFEHNDSKVSQKMADYLEFKCYEAIGDVKLSGVFELSSELKTQFGSKLDQLKQIPKVLLEQHDAVVFFIRETPLSLQELISFIQEGLPENDLILPNIRLLQKIHEAMGYDYKVLIDNPVITSFIAKHFDVLSAWLNKQSFELESLVNLLAADSVPEVTVAQLHNLSTLRDSRILPISIVLAQQAAYIRNILSEKFVGAVQKIWDDILEGIPKANRQFSKNDREKLIDQECNMNRPYDLETGAPIQSNNTTLLTIPEGVFSLIEEEHINVQQILALTKEQAAYLVENKEVIITLSQSSQQSVFDLMSNYESLAFVVALLKSDQRDDTGTKQEAVRWCLEPGQTFLLPYLYPNFSLDDSDFFFKDKLPWIQGNRDRLEAFVNSAYTGVQIAQFFEHTPEVRALFLNHPPRKIGDEGGPTYNHLCRELWHKSTNGGPIVLQAPFYLSEEKQWLYREPSFVLDIMRAGAGWSDIVELSSDRLQNLRANKKTLLYFLDQKVSFSLIAGLRDDQIGKMHRYSGKSDTHLAQIQDQGTTKFFEKTTLACLQNIREQLCQELLKNEVHIANPLSKRIDRILEHNHRVRKGLTPHPIRWGILSGAMGALAVLAPLASSWLLPTFVLNADALSVLPSGLLLGLGIAVAVLAVAAAGYAAKKTHDHRCRLALFNRSDSTNRDSLDGSFEKVDP